MPETSLRVASLKSPSPDNEVLGRRKEIIRIAARLFAEFGFEATTIRAIGDEANILSGSIYYHFDTKDEILDEVIRNPVTLMRDRTIRISSLNVESELKVIALILLWLRELTHSREAHSILYNERKLLRRKPGFEYVVSAKRDAYFAWRTVLKDGVETGLFKPDIDGFLTIVTITRMLNTCADWLVHDSHHDFRPYGLKTRESGRYSLDQFIDFNIEFILSAIRHARRVAEPIRRQDAEKLIKQILDQE